MAGDGRVSGWSILCVVWMDGLHGRVVRSGIGGRCVVWLVVRYDVGWYCWVRRLEVPGGSGGSG